MENFECSKTYQNKLFSKVAIQPTPDLAPPAPVMQDSNFALLTGLIGAGVSGFSTYGQFKADNPFGTGGKKGGNSSGVKANNYNFTPVNYDYTSGSINYYGF